MRFGISAASLIVENDKILLVHHFEKGKYDFWIPPGGSMKGSESIFDCARRETLEETGLTIEPGPILYIQQFHQPDYHFVKFFILAMSFQGTLTTQNIDADEDFLVDAGWFSRDEIKRMSVYPEALRDEFWKERLSDPILTRYLGLEEIKF